MDSADAVGLIKKTSLQNHRLFGLILAIKKMVDDLWSFRTSTLYREQNMTANCISRLSSLSVSNSCFLSFPPAEVACILNRDIFGSPYLHLKKS